MSDGNGHSDVRDILILALAERLYICSSLLTRAAERLKWDSVEVKELVQQLKDVTKTDIKGGIYADIKTR